MNFISSIFDLLANAMGFARKRQELANSPEQQANAAARTDAQIKDESRAAIAAADVEKIRKLTGE